ncbi:MAG TPA: hypothetical protein VEU52_04230 [Candidatus Limnocylindrales bacterium]|jgi:hypothetical protein|nr:hypothetical protein [Candidatus Limnocylindrales bacterium]
MEHFIEFAEVTGAILVSMGLAMWMEWYCLRWLMRLMPGTSLATAVEDGGELHAEESVDERGAADDATLAEESAKAA